VEAITSEQLMKRYKPEYGAAVTKSDLSNYFTAVVRSKERSIYRLTMLGEPGFKASNIQAQNRI